MKLQSITLSDFKGVPLLDAFFNGQNACVYGVNGAGKSTLATAFLWLLTGKDAGGRADYQIKPLGSNGVVAKMGTEPTVTAIIHLPGDGEVKLTRSLHEKWATKRGRSEKEYKGDETRCYIDDVPKSVTEYANFVAAHIGDEPTIRLLSNTTYFNGQIDNNARRNHLLQTFSRVTDDSILSSCPALAPLHSRLTRHSVQEFQAVMQEQRRRANEQIQALPIRIDEASKALQPEVDEAAAQAALSEIGVQLAQARHELAAAEQSPCTAIDAELAGLQQQITAQRQRLAAAQQAEAERVRTVNEITLAQADSQVKLAAIEAGASFSTFEQARREIDRLKAKLTPTRESWAATNRESFNPQPICQVCGQELPAEAIAEQEKAWNLQHAARLEAITALGRELAQRLEAAQAALAAAEAHNEACQQRLQQAQEAQQQAAEGTGLVQANPDAGAEYAAQLAGLEKQATELQARRAALAAGEATGTSPLAERIAALEARQQEQQAAITRAEQNRATRQRIAEYEEQHRKQLDARDDAEHMLELCDQFTREKVSRITEEINSHFQLVRFKLFENQKNGGIKQVCEATVDGVPYEALNRARRVAASLDIITTFGKALGTSLPVFIDDAEGVYNRYGVSTEGLQTITLYANEEDTQLRIQLTG